MPARSINIVPSIARSIADTMLKGMSLQNRGMAKAKETVIAEKAYQIMEEKKIPARNAIMATLTELSLTLSEDRIKAIVKSLAQKYNWHHPKTLPARPDVGKNEAGLIIVKEEEPPPIITAPTLADIQKMKSQLDEEKRAMEERQKALEQKEKELAEQAKKIEESQDIQIEVAGIKPYMGTLKSFNFPLWMWILYQLEESYGFKGTFEDYMNYLGDYYVRSNNKALALIDVSAIAMLPKEGRSFIKILDTRMVPGKITSNIIVPEKPEAVSADVKPAPEVKEPEQEDRPVEFYLKQYGEKAGIPYEEMKQRLAVFLTKMKDNPAQ